MVEECAARREECRYVTVKISPWTSDALPLALVLAGSDCDLYVPKPRANRPHGKVVREI